MNVNSARRGFELLHSWNYSIPQYNSFIRGARQRLPRGTRCIQSILKHVCGYTLNYALCSVHCLRTSCTCPFTFLRIVSAEWVCKRYCNCPRRTEHMSLCVRWTEWKIENCSCVTPAHKPSLELALSSCIIANKMCESREHAKRGAFT